MGRHEKSSDDSLFIRAFDDAISKYKVMHGQSADNEEVYSGRQKNVYYVDRNHERIRGEDEKSNIELNNAIPELGENTKVSLAQENIGVEVELEPHVPISSTDLPNALFVEETQKESADNSSLDLNGAANYNQLLNQYYEIEEKRQKILEQLYQYGGWNYQNVGDGTGGGVEQGVSSTYPEHPVSASQTSYEHVLTTCCPSKYPISAGPETSSVTDGDIIKAAMDAAERAISSLKTKNTGDCDVNNGREREGNDGVMVQNASSETDLAAVLNAWFSAGFYTGKYVMQQSYGKK